MASNSSTELNHLSTDRESELLNPLEVETEPQRQNKSARKKVHTAAPSRRTLEKVFAIIAVVLLLICVIVIALLIDEKRKEGELKKDNDDTVCEFSKEAQRTGLDDFLRKVREMFYEYNRAELELLPGKPLADVIAHIKARYRPMNFTPEYLKEKTDVALSLYDEIRKMDINENQLKPKEAKAVYQVKLFLQTTFAIPYDENFYGGDWMLGPNPFCWQSICVLPYDLFAYSHYVKPGNLVDLEDIIKLIYAHGEAIKQYESNMRLGVLSGMVRSSHACKSGLSAFKTKYRKIMKDNNPKDVLQEPFTENLRKTSYLENLSKEDQMQWLKSKGESAPASIDKALIKGLGMPLVEFVKYLENEHLRHCLPSGVSSGLAGIPVDYIYADGLKTTVPTKKVLPLTGGKLSGKDNYIKILPSFTTSDITPDEINMIGWKTLNKLYPQAIEIARNITGKSANETEEDVILEFRKILYGSEQFFNDEPFPTNESDVAAYRNCSDTESAKLNCPKRWAAMRKWADYGFKTLGRLAPKLTPLFYHTEEKNTIPNCPLEMKPGFNPSIAAQSYHHSTKACSKPATIVLPFFLNNFGPLFADWSVVAHEGWPGHHTQIQGRIEHFGESCGGILKWLDGLSKNTFFSEGWALYSENPVIAEDTDTYDEEPLYQYGMLQWQIWRALRLIVDTGLHYRGMNRTTALGLFLKYGWDDSDLAEKEVTRYMGVPGQATSYTLGQQKIVELRKYCEKELGEKFNLKDFHYQILLTGSAPASYLDKYIKQYVECAQRDSVDVLCDHILNPMPKSSSARYEQEEKYEDLQGRRQFPHFV